MEQHRIKIWPECSPVIAEAIELFSDKWKPYSTRSRLHSIYSLVKELIDPAWKIYIASLPSNFAGRMLSENIVFSDAARSQEFRDLEHQLKQIGNSFSSLSKTTYNIKAGSHSYQDPKEIGIQGAPVYFDKIDAEFSATIDTLYGFAMDCANKYPQKIPAERLNAKRVLRSSHICKFCGEITQLEEHIQKTPRSVAKDIDKTKLRLSAKYCENHRSRLDDNTANPVYRTALRQAAKFTHELTRLERQSWSTTELRAGANDLEIDIFLLNIVAQNALYPLEDKLRDKARELVVKKISDRKKRIVIMHASGFKQIRIAEILNISPQAVNKALHSVPASYRYDILKRKFIDR
jgi:hypothetical protein